MVFFPGPFRQALRGAWGLFVISMLNSLLLAPAGMLQLFPPAKAASLLTALPGAISPPCTAPMPPMPAGAPTPSSHHTADHQPVGHQATGHHPRSDAAALHALRMALLHGLYRCASHVQRASGGLWVYPVLSRALCEALRWRVEALAMPGDGHAALLLPALLTSAAPVAKDGMGDGEDGLGRGQHAGLWRRLTRQPQQQEVGDSLSSQQLDQQPGQQQHAQHRVEASLREWKAALLCCAELPPDRTLQYVVPDSQLAACPQVRVIVLHA